MSKYKVLFCVKSQLTRGFLYYIIIVHSIYGKDKSLMKKVLSVLLSIIMIVSVFSSYTYADNRLLDDDMVSDIREEVNRIVDKSLSRTDDRILRFIISADAHQDNDNILVTRGTAELGQAQGEILDQLNVDFVANLGDLAWGSRTNTVAEVT